MTLDRADDHAHTPRRRPARHRAACSTAFYSTAEPNSRHEAVAEQDSGARRSSSPPSTRPLLPQPNDRWATLIRSSGLTDEQADSAIESNAFGPLPPNCAAEANHHDVETLLPRLVAARGFSDADDIAAVLHYRVERATTRPAGSGRTWKPPRLIAGLIPRAHGVTNAEMRAALDEREALIEARADAVLDVALAESTPWIEALGETPSDRRRATAWRKAARVVAAYRDRYRIADDAPQPAESTAQKIDAARARSAIDRAVRAPCRGRRRGELRGPSAASRTVDTELARRCGRDLVTTGWPDLTPTVGSPGY